KLDHAAPQAGLLVLKLGVQSLHARARLYALVERHELALEHLVVELRDLLIAHPEAQASAGQADLLGDFTRLRGGRLLLRVLRHLASGGLRRRFGRCRDVLRKAGADHGDGHPSSELCRACLQLHLSPPEWVRSTTPAAPKTRVAP